MVGKPSTASLAWAIFDRITREASDGGYSNPWVRSGADLAYRPDFQTLSRLLGVALHLNAGSQSGVPAFALDVWVAFELRRAGFDEDAVWPRATEPRVLPSSIANLLKGASKTARPIIEKRIRTSRGVVASSAHVLGKNYVKQVDVVMSDWATGPELMISTKRMDSSFGKNAANRVEESYGDAKNLRLRHPQAALGFLYGLRSTILTEEPVKAEWLIDLLGKLGHEDDAYHAVALLLLDYDKVPTPDAPDGGEVEEQPLLDLEGDDIQDDFEELDDLDDVPSDEIVFALADLPEVRFLHDRVPSELQPSAFLAKMVNRVLANSPIDFHPIARARRRQAAED